MPHAPRNLNLAFSIGTGLNLAFVAVEAIYGYRTHSLALIADAGHNLSDVLGLLLAWGASVMTRWSPSRDRTYGFRRTSILASLLNAAVLLVAMGAVAWEALGRFGQPAPVAGGTVMAVAAVGVVINAVSAGLFMAGQHEDLNIRSAFFHLAADAGVSLGVVVAGAAIVATGWAWIDPVVSLLIVTVVLWVSWGLLKDSVDMALDAVPPGIDAAGIEAFLADLPGVEAVHDLHIWAMSTTEFALTAHLLAPDSSCHEALLAEASCTLQERFEIAHPTLQVETRCLDAGCRLAPNDAV